MGAEQDVDHLDVLDCARLTLPILLDLAEVEGVVAHRHKWRSGEADLGNLLIALQAHPLIDILAMDHKDLE